MPDFFRVRFYALFLTLLFLGCASNSTKDAGKAKSLPPELSLLPPDFEITSTRDFESVDRFLINSLESAKTRTLKWWIEYKRGLMWIDRDQGIACEQFARLAKEPLFPLAKISYLRALESCPKNSSLINEFAALNIKELPPWQRDMGLNSAIRRAEKDEKVDRLMRLSFDKSKLPLPKPEKVKWAEKAASLARSIGKRGFERKMLSRIERLRPSRMKNPPRSKWLDVAYDHRRQRNFKLANAYYSKVIRSQHFGFKQKLKAYKGLRKSYKNNRQMEEYLKTTLKMALFVEKKFRRNKRNSYYRKQFHDNFVTLARTQWTMGEVRKAGRTLKILQRVLKSKYPLAEVYWLRGRMDEEKKKFKSAVRWFNKALKEPIASDEFREKISWYLAWNQKKLGNQNETKNTLERLISMTENDFAKSKYQFWLAKTLESAGDKTNSQLTFQKLINEDPLGFYGLVAHNETNQLIPASEAPPSIKPKVLEKSREAKLVISKFADLQILEWLISLEEFGLAKNYLNSISSNYRKKSAQDEFVWLEIFNYYGRAGEYLSLFEQLGKLTPERRKFILDENPSLVFPRPFADLVKSASDASGVQQELIYSIMRQESAFNPRARSFADAYGLLQMLPENAAKDPQANSLNYRIAEDLYRPEVNIPIGASFLKKISQKWNDQFILLVASYNANDKAIRGWIQTRYRGNSLEFIEDIPYEETRGYIRLVMRNLIFYSLLESNGERIPFPTELLKLDFPIDSERTPLKEASL